MRRPHLDRLLAAAHRRRIGAGLALLAVVGVVVAIVLVTQSSTPPGASAASQASGSTAVQRRNLVATDTESGTLSYAAPQTVYDRLSGTITWLPSIGQVIRPGQALFKVAGQPVILMNGSTPAYRNLNASDTAGPDILQLNRNLVALGFNPDGIVVDDTWQAATTAAVEVLQQSLGQSPTGDLSLGQIVFLPGAQVVTTVQANLGSGGGGGTGSPAAAADRPASPGPEFVSLTTTTPSSGTPTTTTPGTSHKPKSTKHHPGHSASGTGQSATSLQALIALLRAEIAELKAASHGGSPSSHGGSPSSHGGSPSSHGGSPSSHGGSPSSGGGNPSGGGGGNATAVLQTASTELVATVALDASKQSEARVGEKVTVEMPAGNTVNGTITAVSPVAQSSSNSGNGNSGNGNSGNGNSGNGNSGNGSSGATIPVTIALSGHQSGAGLDQASVSVNFMKSEANNVLSVPVTALLATGGGGYAIQNAAAPHNLIPVTTGLFAAGYVQISGSGIYPGLRVTDSQG